MPSATSRAAADRLLAELAERARGAEFEGVLAHVGEGLGMSPTRVSRAIRLLLDEHRVELVRRGHGRHATRLRILDAAPLGPHTASARPPTVTDRLLGHLQHLSSNGMVERPLVQVARELGVQPPSVSRALGQLVAAGLARVDQVGTRGRPTRIEILRPPAGGEPTGPRQASRHESRRDRELAAAHAEIARLRAELACLLGADETGIERASTAVGADGNLTRMQARRGRAGVTERPVRVSKRRS